MYIVWEGQQFVDLPSRFSHFFMSSPRSNFADTFLCTFSFVRSIRKGDVHIAISRREKTKDHGYSRVASLGHGHSIGTMAVEPTKGGVCSAETA